MKDLVVIGAGGFGREVLDVVEAINKTRASTIFNVVGVIDDNPSEISITRLRERGYKVLGSIEEHLSVLRKSNIAVAIGNPLVRKKIVDRLSLSPDLFPNLIHPSANVGSKFSCDHGVVICAGVNISTNVRLSSFVHVNPAATIGHDSQLMNFVSVNPGAVISGEVTVCEEVLVGANATILQNLIVGNRAIVGASACVTKNIPASSVAKGIPARW